MKFLLVASIVMCGHFSFSESSQNYIQGDSNHKPGIGLSQSVNEGYGSSEFNRIKFKDDSYHKTNDPTKATYGKHFYFDYYPDKISTSKMSPKKESRSEIPGVGTYIFSKNYYGANIVMNKLWNKNADDTNKIGDKNTNFFSDGKFNLQNATFLDNKKKLLSPENYDSYLNLMGDFGFDFSLHYKRQTSSTVTFIDKNNLLGVFGGFGNTNIIQDNHSAKYNSLNIVKYTDNGVILPNSDNNVPYFDYPFTFVDKKGESKTWHIGAYGIEFSSSSDNIANEFYAINVFSDSKGQEHVNIDKVKSDYDVNQEINNTYYDFSKKPSKSTLSLSDKLKYINFLEGQKMPENINTYSPVDPISRKSLTAGSNVIKSPQENSYGSKNITGQTRIPKKPKDRSKDATGSNFYHPDNFTGETLIQNWTSANGSDGALTDKYIQSKNNAIVGFRTRYVNLYGFDRDINSSDSDSHSKYNPIIISPISDQLNDSTIAFQFDSYYDSQSKLWLNTNPDNQLAYNNLNSYDFTSSTNPDMVTNDKSSNHIFKTQGIHIIQNNPRLSTGGIVGITLTFLVTVPVASRVLYLAFPWKKRKK